MVSRLRLQARARNQVPAQTSNRVAATAVFRLEYPEQAL
jgi:hypothetical protein